MGLKAIKEIKREESSGVLSIDLSHFCDGDVVATFRAPKAADLYPDSKTLQKIKIAYPECPEEMLAHINLLGRCYIVQQEDDGEDEPWRAWVSLARNHYEAFFHVLTKWLEFVAIPSKDELKNDSVE